MWPYNAMGKILHFSTSSFVLTSALVFYGTIKKNYHTCAGLKQSKFIAHLFCRYWYRWAGAFVQGFTQEDAQELMVRAGDSFNALGHGCCWIHFLLVVGLKPSFDRGCYPFTCGPLSKIEVHSFKVNRKISLTLWSYSFKMGKGLLKSSSD